MIEMNLDEQTKQLEGTVDQLLWDLSILDYRANELKLACEESQREHDGSSEAETEPEGSTPRSVTH